MGRRDWYYVHLPKLLIKRLDSFIETPRAKSMGMTNRPELLRRVINEFLEEQEKLYNSLESIEEFILEMKDYDHLVITFNDKTQLQEIVINFVKRGINNNNLNVLFITREEEPEFINVLNNMKNVNSLFRSEDIMIVNADDYLQGGTYLIEPVIKSLDTIREKAKGRSKSGLSVIGTPPGVLIEQGKYDEANNIEIQFHEAIQKSGIPATFLCLYKSLPQELEGRFSECHDLIVKRAVTSTRLA
ncbi:MAG TPA: MEDS domain-containing protein [Nitrososphaeraceae archaeon]|nr:MEDS domain-containing protein [Nitrososphaeraceae archaeon]